MLQVDHAIDLFTKDVCHVHTQTGPQTSLQPPRICVISGNLSPPLSALKALAASVVGWQGRLRCVRL